MIVTEGSVSIGDWHSLLKNEVSVAAKVGPGGLTHRVEAKWDLGDCPNMSAEVTYDDGADTKVSFDFSLDHRPFGEPKMTLRVDLRSGMIQVLVDLHLPGMNNEKNMR